MSGVTPERLDLERRLANIRSTPEQIAAKNARGIDFHMTREAVAADPLMFKLLKGCVAAGVPVRCQE